MAIPDISVLPGSALDALAAPDRKRAQALLAPYLDASRHKVVVLDDDPTGIQTVHTVTDLPQGSEHKNGDGYAVGSGTFEQRKAVQFRQHPVQDAGIVVSGFEKMQTIGTCMAAIGGKSCCL